MPKAKSVEQPAARPPAGSRSLLRTWYEDFEQARESSPHVLINLLLTHKCNLKCAHCMMEAGPDRPAAYLSEDAWLDIAGFAAELKQLGLSVEYNMVGGEPTLNLNEFERVCNLLASTGDCVEMTTNGWWMADVRNINKVAKALLPLLESQQMESVRISNSAYHDTWRSKGWKPSRIANYKPALVDNLWDWSSEDGLLGALDEDTLIYDEEMAWRTRLNHHAIGLLDEVLHADKQDAHGVTSTGRALENQLTWKSSSCGRYDRLMFTFNPDASIHDLCCNGGKVAAGHARENLALLWRRFDYLRHLHKEVPRYDDRCGNCALTAIRWKNQREQAYAEALRYSTVRGLVNALDDEGIEHDLET